MSRFETRAKAGVNIPRSGVIFVPGRQTNRSEIVAWVEAAYDRIHPGRAFIKSLLRAFDVQETKLWSGSTSAKCFREPDAFDPDAPDWRLAVESGIPLGDAGRLLRAAGGDLRLAREMARMEGAL